MKTSKTLDLRLPFEQKIYETSNLIFLFPQGFQFINGKWH